MSIAGITARISQGLRIGRDEARWLWTNASDEELRSLAAMVRDRFHEPGSCTYMVMRIINYTNVCVAQCDYCAFYKLPTQDGGYVLSHDEVFAKLDELLGAGWRPGGVQWRVQSASAAELLLRAVCSDPCAIRGRAGVLCADDRGVPVPRRSCEVELCGGCETFEGRRGAVDYRRWFGDSDGGVPGTTLEVQVHGGTVLRCAASDR